MLIVPTTKPEDIEQYSIRVVEAWKLGREKPDDGALLLVAMEDRTLRIEVGHGLEGALPDLVSNRIIDETITPLFREGDFSGGISAGVDRMIRVVDGEALPPPDEHWSGESKRHRPAVPAALLRHHFRVRHPARDFRPRARLGRDGRRRPAAIAWVFTQLLGASLGAGVVALLVSLLMGFGNGGRWSSRPGSGGWRSGGWGGGGFGSSGGGGGGSAAAAADSVAAARRGAGR